MCHTPLIGPFLRYSFQLASYFSFYHVTKIMPSLTFPPTRSRPSLPAVFAFPFLPVTSFHLRNSHTIYLPFRAKKITEDHLYRLAIALAAILQYQYCSRSSVTCLPYVIHKGAYSSWNISHYLFWYNFHTLLIAKHYIRAVIPVPSWHLFKL